MDRIQMAVLGPDPYWEYVSGSRIMEIVEIDQNSQINLVPAFPKGFRNFVGMFFYLLSTFSIFFM